ncbi:COX15/CtaA family protein [soil metagenome]
MEIVKHRSLLIWLLSGCFLIFLMVIIGGITRLTHSGLSIVEWKFAGSLPPMNEMDWQILFEKYQHSPEYKLINSDFTIGDFKNIFWLEYIHRMIGRLTGLVFILPLTWFFIRRKISKEFFPKIAFLLFLGFCQGLLGWAMVKSGLNKVPHVSHYLLAAHLSLAFTTFGFTLWFALGLAFPMKLKGAGKNFRTLLILTLILVSTQIIYGAFVAGLHAGLLFPTFPKMGENWIAPEVYFMHPMWKNIFENGAGVQFVHRILAFTIVIMTIVIFIKSKNLELSGTSRKIIFTLGVAVFLQFCLGLLTLLLHVPVLMASLHQIGAFILFSVTILVLFRFRQLH